MKKNNSNNDKNYIYINAFFYSFWIEKSLYSKYIHKTLKEFMSNIDYLNNNNIYK